MRCCSRDFQVAPRLLRFSAAHVHASQFAISHAYNDGHTGVHVHAHVYAHARPHTHPWSHAHALRLPLSLSYLHPCSATHFARRDARTDGGDLAYVGCHRVDAGLDGGGGA